MHYSLKRLTTRVQCDVLLAYAQAKLGLPTYPDTPARPDTDPHRQADRHSPRLASQGQLGVELFGASEPGAIRTNFPLSLVQNFITRVMAHRATLPG